MKKLLLPLLLALAFVSAREATGCTIPVFRYALEKWDLTPYDILVYNHGPLPPDLQKSLKPWMNALRKANIDLMAVDLDGKVDAKHAKLWERFGKGAKGPWMLVRSQSPNSAEAPAWSGPCTQANLDAILDSPMRRAILAHLTRGSTVVYVLVTSDDPKADKDAYDMVRSTLQDLEKRIKLPEQSKDGPQLKLPLPLKVSLPLLVLDRSKPEEAAFVRILLGVEEDLDKKKGPILFPIFGRGRALAGLYEEHLSEKLLSAATEFLCKECSCQVKELNPGVDLLMATNWNDNFDMLFEKKDPIPMPKLLPTSLPVREIPVQKVKDIEPIAIKTGAAPQVPAPAGLVNPSPDAGTTTDSVSAQPEPCCYCPMQTPRFWLWVATGGAGLLVVGSGAWLIRSWIK